MAIPPETGFFQYLQIGYWPLARPHPLPNAEGVRYVLAGGKTRQGDDRPSTEWLSEADSARHQAGHEDHQHDKTHLDMVNDIEAAGARRVRSLAALTGAA